MTTPFHISPAQVQILRLMSGLKCPLKFCSVRRKAWVNKKLVSIDVANMLVANGLVVLQRGKKRWYVLSPKGVRFLEGQ